MFYLEGKSTDVEIRRANFIHMVLEYERGFKIIAAPTMERSWDFKVVIDGEEDITP